MDDALDSLDAIPASSSVSASDLDPTPGPFENYTQAAQRVSNATGAALSQTRQLGRVKAADFTSRGIPYTTDATGDTSALTDWTGAALTSADPRNKVAYDSTGNPVDYSQRNPQTGKPVVQDAFANTPVTTDQKTGDQYKIHAGLPWQYQGQDPDIAAANTQAQQATINRQTSAALAAPEADAQKVVRNMAGQAKLSAKNTGKTLTGLGVPLTDDTGNALDLSDIDAPTLQQHIESSFNQLYAAPEANATPLFGGGEYSKDAQAIRTDLDNRKQQAMQAAVAHVGVLNQYQQAQDNLDQISSTRQSLAADRLATVNQKRAAAGMAPVTIPGMEEHATASDLNAPAQPAPGIPGLGASGPAAAPPTQPQAGVSTAAPAAQPEGALQSFLRPLESGVVPALGTAGGAALGALGAGLVTAPSGPGAIAGAIAGDVAGGAIGGALAQKAQNAAMGGEWTAENQAKMAENAKNHPIASALGGAVPMLVSMLGGSGIIKQAGIGLEKAAQGLLSRTVSATEGNPGLLTKAMSYLAEKSGQLPALLTTGARISGAEAAQQDVTQGNNFSDVLPAAIKGAVTFGPTAFVPAATTLMQTAGPAVRALVSGGKGLSMAAVMEVSNALYDHFVEGKPIDAKEMATRFGSSGPAFAIQEALMGVLHGVAPASDTAESAPQLTAPPTEKLVKGRVVEPTPPDQPPPQPEGKTQLPEKSVQGRVVEPEKPSASVPPPLPTARVEPVANQEPVASSKESSPQSEIDRLQKQVTDSTLLRDQASREGNGMAVAIHDKERADAQNELNQLQTSATPSTPPAEPETTQAKTPSATQPRTTEAPQTEPASKEASPSAAVSGSSSEPTTEKANPATVDDAAHEAATSPLSGEPMPTPAQVEAGNHLVGRAKIGPLQISVQHSQGAELPEGAHATVHKGWIRGTQTGTGENMPVMVKPGISTDYQGPVHVVNNPTPDGKTEHTAVIGAQSPHEAVALHNENSPTQAKIGDVATFKTVQAFHDWASKSGHAAPAKGDLPLHVPGLEPTVEHATDTKDQAGKSPATSGSSVEQSEGERPPATDSAAVREHQDANASGAELGSTRPTGKDSFSDLGKLTKPSEAKQIALLYNRDNRRVLDALGISKINFGDTSVASGAEFYHENHQINLSPEKAAQAMDAVRTATKDPARGKAWLQATLDHEAIHAAQNKVAEASGKTLDALYTDGWKPSDMPDDLKEAARKYYGPEWDEKPEWQQRAEAVRMIVEDRWKGKITEAIYKAVSDLRDFFKKLLGLHPESDMLKRQVEATEEILKKAGAAEVNKIGFSDLKTALRDPSTGKMIVGNKGEDHYTIYNQLSEEGKRLLGLEKGSSQSREINYDNRGWVNDDGRFITLRDLKASGGDVDAAAKSAKFLNKEAETTTAAESVTTPNKPTLTEGAKVRVGNSPQLHTITEELPSQKGDLPDEKYFRTSNDKTGHTQVVESRDITPVKERSAAEKAAAKEAAAKTEAELDKRLKAAGMDPSALPDIKNKKAALRRYEARQNPLGAANPMAEDNEQQARWMTRQAQARGFDSVNQLADSDPKGFGNMAKQWRAFHHRQGGNYLNDGAAKGINEKLHGPSKSATTSQDSLADAAAHTGAVREAVGSSDARSKSGAGDQDSGPAERDALVKYAKGRGESLDKLPAQFTGKNIGGGEHDVYLDPKTQRVVKITSGDGESMGYYPTMTKDGGIALTRGTPAQYLDSLKLRNEVFGDDNRLHGVLDKGDTAHAIISQPHVTGEKPTPEQITSNMEEAGFRQMDPTTFYRKRDNVAVFDMKPENAFMVGDSLVPIDGIVTHPNEEMVDALKEYQLSHVAGEANAISHETEEPKRALGSASPENDARKKPLDLIQSRRVLKPSDQKELDDLNGVERHGQRATVPKGTPTIRGENASVTGPTNITLGAASPIVAYHGTPHEVDKFDSSKIGTGEGAQVYGRGLYFADNPAVAEEYKKSISRRSTHDFVPPDADANEAHVLGMMQDRGYDTTKRQVEDVIAHSRKSLAEKIVSKKIEEADALMGTLWNYRQMLKAMDSPKIRESFDKWNSQGAGNTYTVHLDAEPEDLLDWDKPLSQQSESVKSALRGAGLYYEDQTGERIYDSLSRGTAKIEDGVISRNEKTPQSASEKLLKLGIPGIRYLDGNSRERGDGTHNYVMFDDSKIKITGKNGEAVSTKQALGAASPNYGTPSKESTPAGEEKEPSESQPESLSREGASAEDTGKPEEGKTGAERLIRQADEAGLSYSIETLKKLMRGEDREPQAFARLRAQLKAVGKEPLGAGNPINSIKEKIERYTPGLEITRNIAKGIKSLLLPGSVDSEHLAAAETMGARLGEKNRRGEIAAHGLAKEAFAFEKNGVGNDKIKTEENPGMKFMSAASKGRPMGKELDAAKEKIDNEFTKRAILMEEAGVPLQTFRESYFPGMWTRDSRMAMETAFKEAQARGDIPEDFDINNAPKALKDSIRARVDELLKGPTPAGDPKSDMGQYFSKKPLEGSASFRKAKVFDDVGTGAEFGLKPADMNPVKVAQAKMEEMDRFIMAHQTFGDFEKKGDLINIGNDGKPMKASDARNFNRDDWAKIDDKYGTIWRKGENGELIKAGERWAKKPAARIINNYLSSSLYNSPYFGDAYKAWMSAANVLNQSQLGVGSMFHAGFTAMESQVSAAANVIKDVFGMLRGNRSIGDLGKTVAKLPIAVPENLMTGDKVLNAYRAPNGTQDPKVRQIARAVELAGGGFKMEKGLQTDQTQKMVRDWYGNHKLRAAARSPVAAIEMMAKPIMDWLVPRQKAGVFAHMAARIIEMNPGNTMEELTPQFRQAWNRVDARLGQVGYSRLFSNNTAKNVIQALVRAPGWSGGTIAELGGGFKDAAGFVKDWVKTGKMPKDVPDRTAYTIALILTGAILNGAITYALTGKKPEGTDFIAFRTGKKDEQGNDERFMLPSYLKDWWAYSKHPVQTVLNKTHPLISMISELAHNKDYFGKEIRNPDSGALAQTGQAAGYVVKQFEPFWIRGEQKESERRSGTLEKALPLIGVTPAPKEMNQSPAYTLAAEINRERMPSSPITEQQSERRIARSQSVQALRQGDASVMQKALQSGQLQPSDVRSLQEKASLPPLVAQVRNLPLEQAERVFKIATPQEKQQLLPMMVAKRGRSESRIASLPKSRMFAGFQ